LDRLVTAAWLALLALVLAGLAVPEARGAFEGWSAGRPFSAGFLQLALLGTMGELLGGRLATGRWAVRGVRLHQRALLWGVSGAAFALVFPLFSAGVDGLLAAGLIPGAGSAFAVAFWKSFFLNTIYAFPAMVLQKLAGTMIDRGALFSRWPLVEAFTSLDWSAMFRVVGAACLWFWIPANTASFLLPPAFRVPSAALLGLALGLILGVAGRRCTPAPLPTPAGG
jgi:hypothetical protein